MGKYLITVYNNHILTAFYENNRILSLDFEPLEAQSILGNIYVAKVDQVVKNLNAAFLRYEKDKKAYYPLACKRPPIYQNEKKTDKMVQGDSVLVQVVTDAVKTKEPTVTTDLSLTGRYVVLDMAKEKRLNFSKKITDKAFKEEWQKRELPERSNERNYGFILRTNAYGANPDDVYAEMLALEEQFLQLIQFGKMRSCYSNVYQAPTTYVQRLRDAYTGTVEEIVTDSEEIYQKLVSELKHYPDIHTKLRKYEDHLLPLQKLYAVDKYIQEALSKKVWLKSGGYLIIEQTEACVVIDVNTGKYEGRKDTEAAFLKINMEAAKEIAVQMRLRNLSGMILIDFINMQKEENNAELMRYFREQTSHDPIPVTVVDMTKLKLVEVTRKKERKPFAQQYRETIQSMQ